MFGVEELAKDIDKFIFTIREIEEEPPNIKDSTKGFNFSQVTATKIDDDVPEVISSQVPSTSWTLFLGKDKDNSVPPKSMIFDQFVSLKIKYRILLDSGSTVDIFCNKYSLVNVRTAPT